MRLRTTTLALGCCVAGALFALRPAGVDAQHSGGSFGGSRWGSGATAPAPPSRPTKTWGQKTGGVSRPPSYGSTYDPRPNRPASGGGGECAASLAMITMGLVGGLVATRRARHRRP
jgi:uncharacterized membrane protein